MRNSYRELHRQCISSEVRVGIPLRCGMECLATKVMGSEGYLDTANLVRLSCWPKSQRPTVCVLQDNSLMTSL